MPKLIRAEVMKLAKLRAVWALAGFVLAFVCFVNYHSYVLQRGNVRSIATLRSSLADPAGSCTHYSRPGDYTSAEPGVPCTSQELANLTVSVRSQLAGDEALLSAGTAGVYGLGSVAVGLGLFATAVGLIVSIFIVAISLDAEFRRGGLKAVLIREPRRARVFSAKLLGCYLFSLMTLALVLGTLFLFDSGLRGALPIQAHQAAWRTLGLTSWSVSVAAALLMPLLGTAIGLLGSIISDSSLGAIAAMVVFLVVDRGVAIVDPGAARFTVGGAVAGLVRGSPWSPIPAAGVTIHLWPTISGASLSHALAGAWLLSFSAVLLFISAKVFAGKEYR